MGQNKHVVLEINKGHGQLDKTFNKERNQSFHAICLAGISPFYITTHNYPTALLHVTKASSVATRRGTGKATDSDGLHIMSCCPVQLLFSFEGLDSNCGMRLLRPLFSWGWRAAILFLCARIAWMKTRESTAIPKLNSIGKTWKAIHRDYFWNLCDRNWFCF